MSKLTRSTRCRDLYLQFLSLNPGEFGSWTFAYADFDGLTVDETKATLNQILTTLSKINADDLWSELSWHTYNGLEGVLQGVINTFAAFKSSRDQNSYQNFAQQIDSLAYHLRMFGLVALGIGGASLERTSATLESELERLTVARVEVEKLRDEVRTLIAPAVAGSLSEAFTARKTVLVRGRVIWGLVALALGVYCIHATIEAASAINAALIAARVGTQGQDLTWPTIIIRSVVLFPVYVLFGFSFSQYKKERDFEEEYAHKAAVATSLPNYGDLTREPSVRDAIVTGATNVIFSAPTSRRPDSEKPDRVLGAMKDVIDSVAKLVPNKRND